MPSFYTLALPKTHICDVLLRYSRHASLAHRLKWDVRTCRILALSCRGRPVKHTANSGAGDTNIGLHKNFLKKKKGKCFEEKENTTEGIHPPEPHAPLSPLCDKGDQMAKAWCGCRACFKFLRLSHVNIKPAICDNHTLPPINPSQLGMPCLLDWCMGA
jgi:hypothetical protein